MTLHLGQCRHSAELDAPGGLTNPVKLGDPGEVDYGRRLFPSILEPSQAVVSTRDGPALFSEAIQQIEGVVHVRRLVQFEVRHHVIQHAGPSFNVRALVSGLSLMSVSLLRVNM